MQRLLVVLCACHASSPESTAPPPAEQAPTGAISVRTFGATGDGRTDDRAAFQAAIASGHHDVFVPSGTYVIATAPGAHWGLDVPSGVHLHGAGESKTILQQAPGAGGSDRLLHLSGDDVVLEDLTLDGDKAEQTPDKQRHGIFVTDSNRLVVRHVTARNFTGDGFYLYSGAKDSRFVNVLATANDRNGITLGGNVDGTQILVSRFTGSHAQQIDSEPGKLTRVTNTTIVGCDLDGAGVSTDFVLTVSGSTGQNGDGWHIVNNRIAGGIFVVWADHVSIVGNSGKNATARPSVTVYRSSKDIEILGNHFVHVEEATKSAKKKQELAAILVQGTANQLPDRVHIIANELEMESEQSSGIRVEGALDVDITGNLLRGAGRSARGFAGIKLRATNPSEDFRSAAIIGNTIRNFGQHGISVVGNGAAKLSLLEIRYNTFDDDSPVASMTTGISLDDGSGAAQSIVLTGNRSLHGVTVPVANVPANATVTSDGKPLLH